MSNAQFEVLTAVKSLCKSLLGSPRKMAKKIRSFAAVAFPSRKLFQLIDKIPEMKHLEFSFLKSINQVIINRKIIKKINDGYFKNRLVIVAALPKSASSIIGSCIATIQKASGCGAGIRNYARYMVANQDSDLRPELVLDFPQGGVLKYHPRATGKNLKVLDLLGVKYIILLRHPVDQLVALYCHMINENLLEDAINKDSWIPEHIYPLNWRLFQDGVDIEETIRYLINEGYLNAVLSWAADWLHFRDVNRSLILKYEDFVVNQKDTLKNISNFLYGKDLDQKTLMKCNSIAEGLVNKRASDDNIRKYPRGWTGQVGAWKNYFSNQNKRDYISVVKKFLDYYPNASLILDVYPDLLDIESLLNKETSIS